MEGVEVAWVPVLGFALLGVFLLQKAIRRRARRTFAWGRGGGRVPLSRWAYAVWGVTFFCIAFVVAQAPKPPVESAIALFVCFGGVLVVGFVDAHRHRRSSDGDRRERAGEERR